jgi:hypothetical protein
MNLIKKKVKIKRALRKLSFESNTETKLIHAIFAFLSIKNINIRYYIALGEILLKYHGTNRQDDSTSD